MTRDSIVGRQLDEYRPLSLLGQGGMARVYLGVDVRLRRYVALKVIDRPYRADREYMRRFEREAQAVAQLDHPNIVRLYRYGEARDVLYMAMQYIEGADLRVLMRSYKDEGTMMQPEEIRTIIADLTNALDYAHSRGVIHRDIKPSNIMIRTDGRAILADFGLALFAETGTRGEIFGTPEYIAPEQVTSSANAVPQSDLYAVGVLLYELFTGRLPFTHENPVEVALRHVHEQPRPPRSIRPDLSPTLERIILRAMAKDPAARYATGADLLSALDAALAQSELAMDPPTEPLLDVPERATQVFMRHELPPVSLVVEAGEGATELISPMVIGYDEVEAAGEAEPITGPLPITGTLPAAAPLSSQQKDRNPLLLYAAGCLGLVLLLTLCLAATAWLSNLAGLPPLLAQETPEGTEAPEEQEPTPQPTEEEEQVDVPTPTATAEFGIPGIPSLEPPPDPVYRLLLVSVRDDTLFVVNEGSEFPIVPLCLRNGEDEVCGPDWNISTLDSGECVSIWKDRGNPEAPDVSCIEVGQRIIRRPNHIISRSAYEVYYAGRLLAVCNPGRCLVPIPNP